MKITSITVEPMSMPKIDKQWRIAFGIRAETHGALIRIRADEVEEEGLGYAASALHYGMSAGALKAVLDEASELLVGEDPLNLSAIRAKLDRWLVANNQAKSGIDVALHDLVGKALGVPVHQLLGGMVRSEIPVIRILGLKEPAEMAAAAQGHTDEGYRYLKIKAEGIFPLDVARVEAIRGSVGPDVHLTVDANQSYSVPGAIRFMKALEPFDVDLVEQPVHRDDLVGLSEVRSAVTIPVEADEAANSVGRVVELVRTRAVDSISIKLSKLGGLQNALFVARLCEVANISCRMGANVGSRIVNAAAAHLVAAVPTMTYAAELGEYHRLEGDVVEGLDVVGGVLQVPTEPGLGVHLIT